MIEVNGRQYPLWSQFVEGKDKWLGGILEDFGDSMDKALGLPTDDMVTEITDIKLEPNGNKNAWFEVSGKVFNCGFSTDVGGVMGGEEGWITFSGYGGHRWRIKKPE